MKREEIIARLILSTKTKKRQYDLLQVANDIQSLMLLGENKISISKMLGITSGMLNQFLKVKELCPELQKIVAERVIDSVTLVYYVSKFDFQDQIQIAIAIEKGDITSPDIRLIIPYKKKFPNLSISDLIKRIVESRNKKISIIKFPKKALLLSQNDFINRIKDLIDDRNFQSLENNDDFISLRISSDGEKRLRKKSREKNLTLNQFFNTLLV